MISGIPGGAGARGVETPIECAREAARSRVAGRHVLRSVDTGNASMRDSAHEEVGLA
jgi:hypothetical protein